MPNHLASTVLGVLFDCRETVLRHGHPRVGRLLAQVPEQRRALRADVIVLGGDMTGKALIPIVDNGNDSWYSSLLENRHDLDGEDEVRDYEAMVRRRGYYPFRTTSDELRELQATTSGRRSSSTS